MQKSRFSEEQIVGVLKEADAGVPVKDQCRRIGISDATFYHWKAKYGGLEVNETLRLRQLEEENGRLKKIVAQQALDLEPSPHSGLALSDKALESMEFALENEENGQRASEFLERFGIYPAKQKELPQLGATQILDSGEKAGDKEELAIQECMLKLVQTTMERHKVFGTKMPELDEMDVADERHICEERSPVRRLKSIRHEP